MADKDDLIRETVGELLGLATGQPVAPHDASRIAELIEPTIDFLARTDVIYIASADDFDDAFLKPLARYLADECRPKFLQQRNPADQALAREDLSLLQRINGGVTTPTLRVDRVLSRGRRC